jgi:hypothetical protein
MLVDIISVKVVGEHQLWLKFEDGMNGTVDISQLVKFTGVFAPLKEQEQFKKVRLNKETGAIFWPGGADLDPDVLYSIVSGEPIPKIEIEKITI